MPSSLSVQMTRPNRVGLVTVDGRAFPLEAVDIRSRAGGGVAATVLVQQYRNPHAEPLEVLYTLPLPADGAVVGYTVTLGERVIRGEVERRETAQERYRQALIEGRTAGLLEQERADTFTQTLGCLPPGVPVRVEIEVLHPLGFLADTDRAASGGPEWEYRLPTVVGVRYEGAPGRVPDAGRLDVDRADGDGTPVRVAFDLRLLDGAPDVLVPRSPSHDLAVAAGDAGAAGEAGDTKTRVALRASARLDRDVVVCWRATGATLGAALHEGPGLAGDGGRYALLTVTPPAVPRARTPRDLTLLIDASGSMSGAPLETAKRVATELLESLAPDDRFEVLAFASDVKRLTSDLVEAGEGNVHRTLRRLADLAAGGATEMLPALHASLAPLRPGSQRQVVLLTDGEIGFEQEAIARILASLPAGARLHTVGIGSAPNRTLTRGAARAGRGIELIVGNTDDAGAAGRRLCRATAAPVLTDITVAGSAVLGVAPERPRDVFAGAPLVLALELSPAGGVVEITGTAPGGERWEERVVVPERAGPSIETAAAALPVGALFGRERIEDAEMRLAASPGHDAQAILDSIEALGLRHRIASRRTSLVAIAEEPSVDPRAPRRRERLAVEMPAEVSAEGVGYAAHLSFALTAPVAERGRQDVCFDVGFQIDYCLRHDAAAPRSAGSRPAPPPKRLRPRGGRPLSLEDAFPGRLLAIDPARMVVEFEAPDGFDVPKGTVEIFLADPDSPVARATVVVDRSTRPGPVDEGLTVRLTLEIGDASDEWRSIAGDGTGAMARLWTPVLRWKCGRGFVVVTLEAV